MVEIVTDLVQQGHHLPGLALYRQVYAHHLITFRCCNFRKVQCLFLPAMQAMDKQENLVALFSDEKGGCGTDVECFCFHHFINLYDDSV